MYNPFSIFLLAGAAGALAIAYGLWRQRRADQGFGTIASADENALIKIRGTVEPIEQLVAPLTGRACVYHRIELAVMQANQTTSLDHAASRDFRIRDATGTALVIVERARFSIVADIVEIGRASELTQRSRAAFAEYGDSIAEVASVEVLEAIIAPGSTIEIVGHAVREPSREPSTAERGFRDPGATTVTVSGDVEIREKKRERRYLGPTSGRRARRDSPRAGRRSAARRASRLPCCRGRR